MGEKADRLMLWSPRNTTMVSALGFLVTLKIPELELKKPESWKCQQK